MLKKPSEFLPQVQISNAFDELQKAMADAQAAISRVSWLKDKLLAEFSSVQERAEDFELFTEPEAAALLKIETKHLAGLRRRLDLPYCNFGNKPRYSKDQIIEICKILESNSRSRSRAKQAA